MGRKTSPVVVRVGSMLRSWDGKWFADRRSTFRRQLRDDLLVRRYFAVRHRLTSISRLEVERDQYEVVLTIHTSRPAVVIGRGGSGIEQIQRDLKRLLGRQTRLRVNVQEVRNPDTDAVAVATQVVEQLERRLPYRRVLKQAVSRARQAGALGVKVMVAGRLNGAEISRTEWLSEGNVPLHTFRADISYAQRTAVTTYGTIGVKVWINRGDLFKEERSVAVLERRAPVVHRRRQSLAKAAQESIKVKTSEHQGR